jgi:hypothetical protein
MPNVSGDSSVRYERSDDSQSVYDTHGLNLLNGHSTFNGSPGIQFHHWSGERHDRHDPAAERLCRVLIRQAARHAGLPLPARQHGLGGAFTDRVRAAHVIHKVLLRQIAILNYIDPF